MPGGERLCVGGNSDILLGLNREGGGGGGRYHSWERSKYRILPSPPQNKGKAKRTVVLTEQPNKLVKKSETVVNFNFAHDFNLSGKLFY